VSQAYRPRRQSKSFPAFNTLRSGLRPCQLLWPLLASVFDIINGGRNGLKHGVYTIHATIIPEKDRKCPRLKAKQPSD
jgi:hypothetical protein